jgi:hypothetical protein
VQSLTTLGDHATFTLVAAIAVAAGAGRVFAQERVGATRYVVATPTIESWSFGDGLLQTTLRGDTVRLGSATQLSLPVAAEMWFGDRWQLGVAAAFVDERVSLDAADAGLGVSEYRLNGLTDVKVAFTAHLIPDRFLVTLGLNAAPGGTELDPEEIEAVRVFAAPALSVGVPSLGLGNAATAGVVYARPLGSWGMALGGSYEHRTGSTPLVIASGFPALDFNPSDAVHLSLGTEGLVGPHAMTVGVSVDVFSDDEYSSGGQGITSARTRLGPILTGEWQLRVATQQLRELTVYVTERYRMQYSRAGTKMPESSANYLDVGANGVAPLSPRTGLVMGVVLRHQTGANADSAVASAAARVGGATLGLRYQLGNYTLEPLVRAQLGRLDTGLATADVRDFVGTVALTRRF